MEPLATVFAPSQIPTMVEDDKPANAATTPADSGKADAKPGDATGGDSAPPAPDASPTAPKKDAVQERFDKLTAEKYDALRAGDMKDYELERLRAELAKHVDRADNETPEAVTQGADAPKGFPTLEQFGYDESKFNLAVAQYWRQAARSEARAEIEAEKRQEQAQERLTAFQKREADFIKLKPDYVDKVRNARTLPISKEIQEALMESDLGPQVVLHLVDNRDKAIAIMALPVSAQLREIGRIEARLEAEKTPAPAAPKPAVSQAPPPPPKIDSVDAQVEKTPSDMTDKEFTKWRRKFMR